ncbi:MAG: glycoside hydrolase family 88 protein [Lachnospiraceae bacterium]|nr:glycoside hydrolase family 88 protein [Lachnospiraceae bacterium]
MVDEMKNKSKAMADEALFMLMNYPRYSFLERSKRFLRRAAGRKVEPFDRLNWPTGLLANALMAYYSNNLSSEISLVIKQNLMKYYMRFINSRRKILCLDDILAGQALIELHQITGDEKLKGLLDQMVKYLKEHAVDENGSLPYRPAHGNNHVYADGIGMICPFLCKYGSTYNDADAISLACKQIKNFFAHGMDSRTGLPYHGYEAKNQVKHGIIGWGRACGWLMMGLADSLIFMDKEIAEYDEIKQYFRRLVDKVEAYQREDGCYPWQLPAREGPFDTSATAMILYAIARGLENDILIGIHRSRLLRGRETLIKEVTEGKIYNCQAECGGFGVYPQKYDYYPWVLGPALSLFSVGIREGL